MLSSTRFTRPDGAERRGRASATRLRTNRPGEVDGLVERVGHTSYRRTGPVDATCPSPPTSPKAANRSQAVDLRVAFTHFCKLRCPAKIIYLIIHPLICGDWGACQNAKVGHFRMQINSGPAKTPCRDGTTHVIFEPLGFIAKLAALVPTLRTNPTRFHGLFAQNSKFRVRVAPAKRRRMRRLVIRSTRAPKSATRVTTYPLPPKKA